MGNEPRPQPKEVPDTRGEPRAHSQGTSDRRVWGSSKVKVGKETVLEEPVDPVSRRF